MASGSCRSCGAPLEMLFVDLGMSPLAIAKSLEGTWQRWGQFRALTLDVLVHALV